MDENQNEMIERLVAEVAILRSAVALLLAANVSPDALTAYKNGLPSPIEVSENLAEVLTEFARDLDLGITLQSKFPVDR